MCRLAVESMRGMAVSDHELRRGGLSYTVDTARALREAYGPDAEIRFIIGSDTLVELHTWRAAEELLQLADFAIADRRETPLQPSVWDTVEQQMGKPAADKLKASVVPIERVDVSSTQIRKLLREGRPSRGFLRRGVEDYIRKHALYGAKPA
jgi:nicotinate-nucleotide adenylyltransferase